jgi:O-antigen biosynthesis protein WbqV
MNFISDLVDELRSRGILPNGILVFDSLMAFLSLFFALYLRIGDEFLDYTPGFILKNMVVFSLVNISVFSWMQTHKVIWRYMTLEDIVPITMAVLLGSVLFFPLMILLGQQESLPSSMPIINALVLIFLLCLPRFTYRIIYDYHIRQRRRELGVVSLPTVLIGHDETTEAFLREMLFSPEVPYAALGLVTPDIEDRGRSIHGVPILGSIDELDLVIRNLAADVVMPKYLIVTESKLTSSQRFIIAETASKYGINVMHMLHFFTVKNTEDENEEDHEAA